MFSNETIDRLINLNIEIEGILRILKARQDPDAERLLSTLVNEFNRLALNVDVPPTPAPVKTPCPVPEPEFEPQPVKVAEYEQELLLMPDDGPVSITDDTIPTVDDITVTSVQQPTVESIPTALNIVPEPTIGDQDDQPRLADKVARREAQDLSRAFTLNDRFRFVRTIFGANAQKFDEVIARLSTLTDYAQAMGYVYGELGLDANDPDVKSFVSIVSKHFDV